MDKSNGDGVETENSFTLGVIGDVVSGPEQATSGLTKLLPARANHFRFDRNRKYCRLNSQVNNPKASGQQKNTPGDMRRLICSLPVEPEVVFRISDRRLTSRSTLY